MDNMILNKIEFTFSLSKSIGNGTEITAINSIFWDIWMFGDEILK